MAAALPDQWIRTKTGDQLWEKQAEIIRSVAVNPRTAVASCNGAGKSYLAARVATWFLNTYAPSVVLTTAPTDRQVRNIIWKEIHSCYNHAKERGVILGPEPKTKRWSFDPEHFAFGFATRNYDATAFQGIHAPHLLIIVDEGAGIAPAIWEGIYSCLRGGHSRLLVIGNPTTVEGDFFNAFTSPNWASMHISAFETPNVQAGIALVPGLVTMEDIENARDDWGEGSPLWTSRILGQFPDTMENTLITISMVTNAGQGTWTAAEMAEIDPDEPEEIGVDLARYGSDESVFVCRRGILAHDLEAFGAKDLGSTGIMYAAGRLKNFICKHYDSRKPPMKVRCDAVGLGGGVPDRLRELQKTGDLPRSVQVIDVNAGSKAHNDKKYYQADVEWYDGLALRFKNEAAIGPVFAHKRVVGQLSGRKYTVLSDGRYKLESKEEIRKRGGKSPDYADAIAMAYANDKGPLKKAPVPIGVGVSMWERR